MTGQGKVYIIGVGPGDYKLMTIKAAEYISRADVIVYDRLVNSRVLSYAREDAEMVYVGKMPDHHAVPQDGINDILVKKAQEGKLVARVKGGDPFLFGRGGEEAECLYNNGIEFEIVPGVTSAIAVPAYAGIPVTHRDCCSSLHIITGHERPDKSGSSINFEVISRLEGTLVFLMGVKNLPEISDNLMKYGKDKMTPTAVVENGTTPAQRVITGNLGDITLKVQAAGIKSPAVIVVGDVVNLKEKLSWFAKGPLSGKRILVTRSRTQASRLVEVIEGLGGEAVEFPVIKIAEPEDFRQFDQILQDLKGFNRLVFTSVNGVRAFFKRMKHKHIDIRDLSGVKLCAVGQATADELEQMGLNVDYVPEKYTTRELLDGLVELLEPGERVLLARADIASKEFTYGLKERGIDFVDLTVYRTLPSGANRDTILGLLEGSRIDFITFTSSSTVMNLISIIGEEYIDKISKARVVCIGPVTAKTAQESGITVAAVADTYTIDGLVEKLVEISGG